MRLAKGEEHAKAVFAMGAHAITTGNHVWDRWDSRKVLGADRRILRPLNYPRDNGGNGYLVVDLGEKGKAGVLNIQGRVYMQPIDDPFRTADWAVAKIQEETKIVVVDFHADATAEKMAMGWHLDGRVTAVLGTHTHTPTADARILPPGTAFVTDVGMTGPYDSVLGMKKEQAIKRLLTATPHKYEVASHGGDALRAITAGPSGSVIAVSAHDGTRSVWSIAGGTEADSSACPHPDA